MTYAICQCDAFVIDNIYSNTMSVRQSLAYTSFNIIIPIVYVINKDTCHAVYSRSKRQNEARYMKQTVLK